MVALSASVPTQIQGLPRLEEHFPRRYRNQLPLIMRQIIEPHVLEQWATNPQHVIEALVRSAKEQGRQENQEHESGAAERQEPIMLPVMVAEDTKNFMDDPQFTKKVHMSAGDIVHRVIVSDRLEETNENENECKEVTQIGSATAGLKSLKQEECPLCDNTRSKNRTTDVTNDKHSTQPSRFYYRGVVPSTLYTDLAIPELVQSLSLPTVNTTFAKAPNRDLMRIWISLAGAITPLHYDRCHGILIQLVGRKRFVVFSHEDTHGLYPYDGISGPGHASKVRGLGHCFPFRSPLSESSSSYLQTPNQHNIDNLAELQDRWPKIGKTCPWVIDLEPGDALYTPVGFWHEVTSVDHSVSITVPWDMDANELEEVPRHMAF
ncbi:hypothetical protein BG004_006076 [Podila humilis]|nr:hypothetical protein BG004_006076 [Podila humilis]